MRDNQIFYFIFFITVSWTRKK